MMKSKFKNAKNAKASTLKTYNKLDAKDRNFFKSFGGLHPINEIDEAASRKVQIVRDEDDDDQEANRKKYVKKSSYKNKQFSQLPSGSEVSNEKDNEEEIEIVAPYQKLLDDLKTDDNSFFNSNESNSKAKHKRRLNKKNPTSKKHKANGKEADEDMSSNENDDGDQEEIENEDDEEENDFKNLENINAYSQEVLCKDNLETDDSLVNDQFHVHFEKNIESKLVEKLKSNLNDRAKLSEMEQKIKLPSLGTVVYNPVLEESKIRLDEIKSLQQNCIKQRILERLNESIEKILGESDTNNDSTNSYNLDQSQHELLNILCNYVDFYHPNVEVSMDSKVKFTYALHALNHVLKTRSRIIAHNDKIKQSKSSDFEYRDQGLTRPKVLILVPYRKFALKLVKIFISLLMRKSEEYVSNKKRFFDAFGPLGEEDDDDEEEKKDKESEVNTSDADNKENKAEDFNLLFSGNTDDHFKIGLSISKKSLKLFTEFYSSDIIIASPLGLKSIIGVEGSNERDYDFLSSIEMLIIDNSDILMMQNWEHILTVFEYLHLQPKKSHDVDFSRVRYWLLDGFARYYRQTILFSRIPAPEINSIFNKYCQNYAGKCQINLLKSLNYQVGTICKIGFQLSQVFHRIECDSPVDLPNARFNFFVEKILPRFKDEMMSHTLVFIPSYFDYVKIRNYFKKNDINSMNISEYSDNKSIDRARYLFYHGKVHFMLLTERFHFYKRYKIRGINHLIFFELPHYAEFYSNFCNYLPDAKRFKNGAIETFSSTVLYSKFDAQRLCAVVGQSRATHMVNSEKSVHMFMVE